MRETYQAIINESTPGRFEGEPPMTAYVYDLFMNGDSGDDEVTLEHLSAGWNRYGRRVLCFSEVGFIHLETFGTVAAAEAAMTELHDEYDSDEEF